MPELPEVEAARYTINENCAESECIFVDNEEQGGGPRQGLFDDIVHDVKDGEDQSSHREALLGRVLISAKRRGKQLWLELSAPSAGSKSTTVDLCVLIHLGMTGSIILKGGSIPTYKAFKIDDTQFPPKFAKLHIKFSNGTEIAFCDPRRLGRVRIKRGIIDATTVLPVSKLACDPLLETIDPPTFLDKLQTLSGCIKAALLDQEKLVSGIGNWIADEVLYQTGIHPATTCSKISDLQGNHLLENIVKICHDASECTRQNKELPVHYLFHYRWGKGKFQKTKDYHGNSITFETVAGRTSAIASAVQKKASGIEEEKSCKTSKYFNTADESKQVENKRKGNNHGSEIEQSLPPRKKKNIKKGK